MDIWLKNLHRARKLKYSLDLCLNLRREPFPICIHTNAISFDKKLSRAQIIFGPNAEWGNNFRFTVSFPSHLLKLIGRLICCQMMRFSVCTIQMVQYWKQQWWYLGSVAIWDDEKFRTGLNWIEQWTIYPSGHLWGWFPLWSQKGPFFFKMRVKASFSIVTRKPRTYCSWRLENNKKEWERCGRGKNLINPKKIIRIGPKEVFFWIKPIEEKVFSVLSRVAI